jgi:hypothetical protein
MVDKSEEKQPEELQPGKSEIKPSKRSSGSKRKVAALVIVVILLIAIPLAYFATRKSTTNPGPTGEVWVLMKGKSGSTENVTLAELLTMQNISAQSSYQNRLGNWKGEGTYRGVPLASLADLVGGMSPGDIMTITGKDGYGQNLSYYQVNASGEYLSTQGTIVLAYSFNSTKAPDWADGPMVSVMSPDGAFSDADLNATVPRDPEFSGTTSAGSLWVKNVAWINITSVYNEWVLKLTSPVGDTVNITRTKFVMMKYLDSSYYNDSKMQNWSGVPMKDFIAMVDDGDPSTLNSTLLPSFRFQVKASDDYNKTFYASDLVSWNDILADRMNGSLLASSSAPLRLAGANITGGKQVKMVTSLSLESIVLTVNGNVSKVDFSLRELEELPWASGQGGYRKSTGTVVGPTAYKGVLVRTLVDKVYSLNNYTLNSIATDGYMMTYSSNQVDNGTFAYYDSGGDMAGVGDFNFILAYEENGGPMPTSEGLRLVVVDNGSGPIPFTDGHLWAKFIRTLNVMPFEKNWNISLVGVNLTIGHNMTLNLDAQTFWALMTCSFHEKTGVYTNSTGSYNYTAVPLWILVSAVDGNDTPSGHYEFNDSYAALGYNVTVYASDGYNRTFTSAQIARNDSFLVIGLLDGKPLTEDKWPLMLYGDPIPFPSNKWKVAMIDEIIMK